MIEYEGVTKQIRNIITNKLNLDEETLEIILETGTYKEKCNDSDNKLAYVIDVSFIDYPESRQYYVYSWYDENAKWN